VRSTGERWPEEPENTERPNARRMSATVVGEHVSGGEKKPIDLADGEDGRKVESQPDLNRRDADGNGWGQFPRGNFLVGEA